MWLFYQFINSLRNLLSPIGPNSVLQLPLTSLKNTDMHWNLRLTFKHTNKSSIIQKSMTSQWSGTSETKLVTKRFYKRETVELNIFSRTHPLEYFSIAFVPFTFYYLVKSIKLSRLGGYYLGIFCCCFVYLLSNEAIILLKPLFNLPMQKT